jgi:hypothetical protein
MALLPLNKSVVLQAAMARYVAKLLKRGDSRRKRVFRRLRALSSPSPIGGQDARSTAPNLARLPWPSRTSRPALDLLVNRNAHQTLLRPYYLSRNQLGHYIGVKRCFRVRSRQKLIEKRIRDVRSLGLAMGNLLRSYFAQVKHEIQDSPIILLPERWIGER